MSIKKAISILGAVIFLVFLIKGLYIDTNLGYTLEASPFSMTGCPLFIEALLSVAFWPFLIYAMIEELCDKVINRFSKKINAN